MSRNFARGFQTTTRNLIRFVGSPLDDIARRNGATGPEWRRSTEAICSAIEAVDSRIVRAEIQGVVAHLSSKDRSDPKEVITVGLQTKSETRVGTLHIHLDGTWRFFPSRAGRDGGYAANIHKANLPGYIPDNDSDQQQ